MSIDVKAMNKFPWKYYKRDLYSYQGGNDFQISACVSEMGGGVCVCLCVCVWGGGGGGEVCTWMAFSKAHLCIPSLIFTHFNFAIIYIFDFASKKFLYERSTFQFIRNFEVF